MRMQRNLIWPLWLLALVLFHPAQSLAQGDVAQRTSLKSTSIGEQRLLILDNRTWQSESIADVYRRKVEFPTPGQVNRRRSPWILPVVGAVAGGVIMAGYINNVCEDNECNLSPVPFIAGGISLGALIGFMIDRSL